MKKRSIPLLATLLAIITIGGLRGILCTPNKAKNAIANIEFEKRTPDYKKPITINKGCVFSTKNSNKASGLIMNLYHPCDWEAFDEPNDNLVKIFGRDLGNNRILLLSLHVTKRDGVINKKEITRMTSAKTLERSTNNFAEYISSEPIEIHRHRGAQIFYRNRANSEMKERTLLTYLFFNNKIISVRFSAKADTEDKAEELYNQNKYLFINLTNNVEIMGD